MYRFVAVALLPLLVSACTSATSPPEVAGYRSPTDVSAGIRNTHHHTPVTGYTHRNPVEPKSWRCVNNPVAGCEEGSGS